MENWIDDITLETKKSHVHSASLIISTIGCHILIDSGSSNVRRRGVLRCRRRLTSDYYRGLHCFKPGLLRLKLLRDVELHIVLEHKPRVRLRFLLDQGGRGVDDGVAARVVEGGDRHPVAVAPSHHPVQHALVLAVRDHLHERPHVV